MNLRKSKKQASQQSLPEADNLNVIDNFPKGGRGILAK
jgi:hypothetical protein